MGHILEHVDDPVEILKLCKKWLSKNGRILSAVPNSHSLHRQAAVKMGIITSENELNERDRNIGHQRVYNIELLRNHFESAGLNIIKIGGYWLKPVTNSQTDKDWNAQMIDAFLKLGEDYPEIAAEIYVVASCK